MTPTTEALGNDKGWEYAVASRVGSLLDESVISGVLTMIERKAVHVAVGRPVDLEAEAARAALTALRERVAGLEGVLQPEGVWTLVQRRAVLAEIDRMLEGA